MARRGTLYLAKTRRLARRLGRDAPGALGILEALWHVAAKERPQGDVGRGFDNADLADAMLYGGDPDQLVEALVAEGWLDRHPQLRLVVHDWPDHADNTVRTDLERRRLTFWDGTPVRRPRRREPDERQIELLDDEPPPQDSFPSAASTSTDAPSHAPEGEEEVSYAAETALQQRCNSAETSMPSHAFHLHAGVETTSEENTHNGAPPGATPPDARASPAARASPEEVVAAVWPELVAAAARHGARWARAPGREQRRLLTARVRDDNATPEDLLAAIEGYVALNGTEPRNDFDPLVFLRAQTIYQRSKFEGYVQAACNGTRRRKGGDHGGEGLLAGAYRRSLERRGITP